MDTENSKSESVAGNSEVVPEWVKKELESVRAEAAKYRTEKRDAVEAARAEGRAELEKQLRDAQEALERKSEEAAAQAVESARLKAVLAAGVAPDKAVVAAGFLKATDPDEIAREAEALVGLVAKPQSVPAVDPSQGETGKPVALNSDSLMQAVLAKIGAPRR